jgi:hypothetical protein
MTVDRYTKVVLTVIAACLIWIAAGGPSLITPASAQGTPVLQPQYQHQQVVIAGWADATGKVYSVAAGAAGGGVPVWVTNR